MPYTVTNSSTSQTMPRRLKQVVMKESIIEKHSFLDDDAFARLQAGEDFHLVLQGGAHLHDARFKTHSAALHHHLGVQAALQQGGGRHHDHAAGRTGKAGMGEHAGLELAVAVIDGYAHLDRARIGVEHGADVGDLAFELLAWHGVERDAGA